MRYAVFLVEDSDCFDQASYRSDLLFGEESESRV